MKSIKLKPTKEECIKQLSFDIREGILRSFKTHKIKNEGSIYKVLGIGFKSFKKHIEDQFEPWMSWENYCSNCLTTKIGISWCIHYKENYVIKTKEDLLKLNNYKNILILCHSEINKYN